MALVPVSREYGDPPKVKQVLKGQQPVDLESVDVQFHARYFTLAYPVTAEVYVSRILDRGEFRRLCDRYKTCSAILEKLR